MSRPAEPEGLSERLGWTFTDRALLARAMAHRSWCAESVGEASNERLEFLGDAVLGLVVTDHVFRTYPDLPEGQLAQVRASVVNADTLAEVATEIDLGPALRLGKGEDASGGREKPSILADAMEAVIGAVYLDGGWDAASEVVMTLLGDRIAEGAAGPGGHDYKTRLQELASRVYDDLPRYRHVSEGPDHAKRFWATVTVNGAVLGRGEGRSKKQAEQIAARMAWQHLAGGMAELAAAASAAADALGAAGVEGVAVVHGDPLASADDRGPAGPEGGVTIVSEIAPPPTPQDEEDA